MGRAKDRGRDEDESEGEDESEDESEDEDGDGDAVGWMQINGREEEMQNKAEDERRGS
jgi:hypothetical protein